MDIVGNRGSDAAFVHRSDDTGQHEGRIAVGKRKRLEHHGSEAKVVFGCVYPAVVAVLGVILPEAELHAECLAGDGRIGVRSILLAFTAVAGGCVCLSDQKVDFAGGADCSADVIARTGAAGDRLFKLDVNPHAAFRCGADARGVLGLKDHVGFCAIDILRSPVMDMALICGIAVRVADHGGIVLRHIDLAELLL